ncbi:MAG: peptidase M15, partial [Bacteroides cellulosilyticus]|nr:peptidase M15 [Bacteroides cellulosilyticus]
SLGLPFDQLIDEKNFAWVHVSYRERANRKQVLAL